MRRVARPFDDHRSLRSANRLQASICRVGLCQTAISFNNAVYVDKRLYFHRTNIAAICGKEYPAIKSQCSFSDEFTRPGRDIIHRTVAEKPAQCVCGLFTHFQTLDTVACRSVRSRRTLQEDGAVEIGSEISGKI